MGDTYLVMPRCHMESKIVRNDWHTFKFIKKYLNKNKDKYQFLLWNIKAETNDETYTSYYSKNEILNLELRKIQTSNKPIILNTSGHFHNRTYAFNLANKCQDYAYIHIDAHPDFNMVEKNKKVQYAGFVSNLLDLDKINEMALIGLNQYNVFYSLAYETKGETYFIEDTHPMTIEDKIKIYLISQDISKDKILNQEKSRDKKFKEEIYRVTKKVVSAFNQINSFSPNDIDNDNVYLSIDLDVLENSYNYWRFHGNMSLDMLLRTITNIGKEKNIIGADICGVSAGHFENIDIARKELDNMYQVYQTLKKVMN